MKHGHQINQSKVKLSYKLQNIHILILQDLKIFCKNIDIFLLKVSFSLEVHYDSIEKYHFIESWMFDLGMSYTSRYQVWIVVLTHL